MAINFIHLNLHTEYSIRDSIVRVDTLVDAITERRMPAVAVTDHMNLFAMVKFYKSAIAAGIKPIIGADLRLRNPLAGKKPFSFSLLCQNTQGYKNLTRLISQSFLEGQSNGEVLLDPAWLTVENTAGLIALSGGRAGEIGRALLQDYPTPAKKILEACLKLFPQRFYLELQRTDRPQEEEYIAAALDLAQRAGVPVVATNAVRFLDTGDFEAHEARVCIHQGMILNDVNRTHEYSEKQYLRTPQEMAELFADLPEALENSVEIAKRCNVELQMGKAFLPNFPIPAETTLENYFANAATIGLEQRLQQLFDTTAANFSELRKPYDERLQTELTVINNMGFAGYFLIVADFIRWSLLNKIPVGPGRGSGAGSLVAFALGITGIDPLRYDLLFERFLNPVRVSMPDFDIDFCMDGRDRVIDYVMQRYGRLNVSQIITFGTLAARAVVRDVGRVLGHPYGLIDKIAKMIPTELGITLEKALDQEELLRERYQQDEEIRNLIDLALKLEGIVRNAGKHAGGVVIAPSALTDFVPLYCEAGSEHLVTQFDKDDVEAVGLVKFDFLGLRTLTIIDWALQTVNQKRVKNNEKIIDINFIPTDDTAVYELLKRCQTTAIFQLESRGMKDLVKRLQPDCFEDIIQLGALFRPGPLQSGMVDDYIDRRHKRARVEYLHPDLQPVLKPTYGIIIYQEQVMQIAQVLAGYSLGEADLLRRAMGKKKAEEMAQQREFFIKGAAARGVDARVAATIFDLMEKFAGYGFNKSHSAAYALVSYQTAWLKAHYPAAFMAAVLSSDMDNTDKIVIFMDECRTMKLIVQKPDINKGFYKFTVDEADHIIYGLGAVKGVGEAAVENIVECRERDGVFHNLFEFCQRVDGHKVNRRALESLIRAGAMDDLGSHRAGLLIALETAMAAAEQFARAQSGGQSDLFGNGKKALTLEQQYPATKPWSTEQLLQGEKESLGYYLSGHPLDRYAVELSNFITGRLVELQPRADQTVTIAGMISTLRVLTTKRNDRIAFLTLDDRSARVEVAVFAEPYQRYREWLVKDQIVVIEGEVSVDEYSGGYRISTKRLWTLEQAREQFAKSLLINVDAKRLDQLLINKLRETLTPFCPGACKVFLNYQRAEVSGKLLLGNKWRVRPADNLLKNLQELFGEQEIAVDY